MTTSKNTNKSTATDIIINSLIDKVINSPKFSWEKMWANIATGNQPHNPITGTVYSGTNQWLLGMYAMIKGTNMFVTEKQAKTKNGVLVDNDGNEITDYKKKHEFAIPLFKFQFVYYDANGKRYYQNQLKGKPKSFIDSLNKKPQWNYFVVYPITQFKGLPEFKTPEIEVKNSKIDNCQSIIDNWECKINFGIDNSRACYSPSLDTINMPHLQAFKNSQSYYMTAFHEIAHSTGAKNRLNRDLSGMFGNEKYAKEELIAELTSVLVGCKMDILTDEIITNTVAYLQSWTKRMQDKRTELYSGLASAMKAYRYIIDRV